MSLKKVFISIVFVSMVVSCSGVQVAGDYEMKERLSLKERAEEGACVGLAYGAFLGLLHSMTGLIGCIPMLMKEKREEQEKNRRNDDILRDYAVVAQGASADVANPELFKNTFRYINKGYGAEFLETVLKCAGIVVPFWILVLTSGCSLMACMGGDIDSNEYNSIMSTILKSVKSPIVAVSIDEFSSYVKTKSSKIKAVKEIDTVVKKLKNASAQLSKFLESKKNEKGEWFEQLQAKGKNLLDAIALVESDLTQKTVILHNL